MELDILGNLRVVRVTDLAQIIDALSTELTNASIKWFRGHSHADWSLRPALVRRRKTLKAEPTLIARFRQSATLLLQPTPSTEWEWLTIMQHYGVPTRLLDWTGSPLAATYFAASAHPKRDGAIWVLDPVALNAMSNIIPRAPGYIPTFEDDELHSYTPSIVASEKVTRLKPIAVIGPRNTPRMQAQLGVFTLIHRDSTPVEDLPPKTHVCKLLLPAARKQHILQELAAVGIGRFQLFPELESLGAIIRGGL